MLKTRLIPSLLLKKGRCIKTKQYADERDTGEPITAARIYDSQGADELLFLDITASSEGRNTLFDIIGQVSKECFMPLTIGGGIRTISDIHKLLKIGADRVAICSAFIKNKNFINKSAAKFGSSTIVGIIAYRNMKGKNIAFIHGKEIGTDIEVSDWAVELEKRGVGEIILHSIDRDGMMNGYDIDLTRNINSKISIPLIISGGAGKLDDFVKAVTEAGVSAVSAASIFHFTDQNLIKARAFMKNSGLNVRSV